VLYICTLCDSTNINTITHFAPNYSYLVRGNGFNGGFDSYLPFGNTHAPCLLKLCIPPSDGIIRGWLFIGFGAEFPLGNCTPTVTFNKHNYIYIDSHSKTNCMIILFPQNGCNVRIKGFHILNAAPFCDDLISLLKCVFNSKLAARVSDFNLLHNLLRP
jgi:hypothetical protein